MMIDCHDRHCMNRCKQSGWLGNAAYALSDIAR